MRLYFSVTITINENVKKITQVENMIVTMNLHMKNFKSTKRL